jgi:beta-glucanase (GH16 family)
MNIYYATRKDEPLIVINTGTSEDIARYEWREWSNCISMMFIKTRMYVGISGSIYQYEKVCDLLKKIDD